MSTNIPGTGYSFTTCMIPYYEDKIIYDKIIYDFTSEVSDEKSKISIYCQTISRYAIKLVVKKGLSYNDFILILSYFFKSWTNIISFGNPKRCIDPVKIDSANNFTSLYNINLVYTELNEDILRSISSPTSSRASSSTTNNNTSSSSSCSRVSNSIFIGGGSSSSSSRASDSIFIGDGGGSNKQRKSSNSILNIFGSSSSNCKSRNANALNNMLTVSVFYPETGITKIVEFKKGFSCSNIMGALVSNVKHYEQGCKAFVKCSNGFYKELLLDQPYYDTMHNYYLEKNYKDFSLSDPKLRDFFPSTPLERGKTQLNSLLADLYKTIHQLKDDDELVFFSSQTPTLQPVMTIDAVKGSVRFNEPMLKALDTLKDTFFGYRIIRGDGNCYFRAFMVGFIEDLIRQCNIQGLQNLLEKMNEVKKSKELRRIKPQRYYQEKEFLNYLTEFITKLENTINYFTGKAAVNEKNLWKTDKDFELDVMRNHELDIALVWSSRLMVSEYLVKNKDLNVENFGMSIDQLFLTCFEEKDIKSTEDYCEKFILKWGEDAESPFIEFGILDETLGCECNIVILEINGNCKTIQYNLPDDKPKYSSVALFLKPGHYDLLVPVGNMQVQCASSNNNSSSSASSSVDNTGWSCQTCTFNNTNCSTICKMCEKSK